MRRRWTILLVLMFTAPLLSQHAPNKASLPSPQGFVSGAFDQSRKTVGANFRGHDLIALFRSLQRSPDLREKGEFETTAAFEARQAKFVDEPLLPRFLPNSLMALVVPHEGWLAESEFQYDADEEVLQVHLNTSPVHDFPSPRVTLRWASGDLGSYAASNAFGATVRVHSSNEVEYGIVFDTDRYSDLIFDHDGVIDRIAMPPDKARSTVPHLRLLLVCRLVSPWLNTESGMHEATISEPRETLYTYNTMYAALSSVWVFDERDGRVLDKIDGGGDSPFPEECWNRSGNEGMLDCIRRVKRRDAQCADAGSNMSACPEQVKATE